jgi:glycosyltransferase involved in cell wall biosynthesis
METRQQEMKIIIASPSLNLLGGAQRACLNAITALRKTNCKLVLATIDKTDWALVAKIFGETPKPDEELYLFSKMPEMPTVALRQAFVAVFYALHLFIITLKHKSCLVVNMGGEIVSNLGDIVYVNAIPLRLMHLFPGIQPELGLQWSIYSRLYSMFLTLLGDGAGTIVANSKFTQTIIDKCIGRKALVINPPVTSRRIASSANWRNRKNTVITISRVRSAKGLEIIPQIAVHLKDCEFVLIGIVDSGSEQCLRELTEEIERLQVQDRVHIFKNKPYSFTLKALSTAKVSLHTQRTEAFGMSIVESMAAGCVPVIPRTSGPWLDILDCEEGLYGLSYRSPSEAADKIRLLIDDEHLRREISRRATERALIFDSSVFEQKLLNIVETVSSLSKRVPSWPAASW